MKKIAVTGSLSSGKTSVSKIFESLGAKVVLADSIVHDLLSQDTSLIQAIRKHFGDRIFVNDKIDRKRLANVVFTQPKELDFLEKLLHPKVRERIHKSYDHAKHEGKYPLFIAEIPLLYETNTEADYDFIIFVDAPEEICLGRFIQRDNSGEQEFYERNKRFFPSALKKEKADFVINNTLSLSHTQIQVEEIYQQISQLK